MPEMDYTLQASQAKLAADAARAAEARMRSEGTDVASPEGMRLEDMEEEDAEETAEADLPNPANPASIPSEPQVTPEQEAELHGVTSDLDLHISAGDSGDGDSSSDGDQTSVGSADGTEVADSGIKP